MRSVPLLLLASIACAGPSTTPVPADEPTENGPSGGEHEPAEASTLTGGACPEALPPCGYPDPGWCTRPDGAICRCEAAHWCGGAAPPPMPPPSWTCSVPEPPCPEPGTPCSAPGSCSRGPCGWENVVQCVNGTWQPVMVAPPP